MTRTRVLITGVTGFVGHHLAAYLLASQDCEVWGTHRRRSDVSHIPSGVELIHCELTDYHSVAAAIGASHPDLIFHLAAQSFVPESWDAPHHTFQVNTLGTLNLLEAVRNNRPNAKVLVAGSSEEYGFVNPDECPITESQPFRPMSPYGASKVAMELLAHQYVRSYGLHIVTTRAFNHTGPGRGEQFVTSNFAKQLAEIEDGIREPTIYVGNLDAKRDWTDVRDIVRAYWLALCHCDPGEPYNICSDKHFTIHDVLRILKNEAGFEVTVRTDPDRLRPSDVPLLWGNYDKLIDATGWQPTIPFQQTLKDLLNYWRERVK